MTPTEGTKSTRSKGRDTDSSHSLFTDLLRRAASPELLAGVAGAAAAAHFTKNAVDRSNEDEPEASAEPAEDAATDESEDEEENVPESESAEAAEDEQPEEPEDEQPEEPEDEQPEEPEGEATDDEETEDEETEEPKDESGEVAEDEQVEEPEDEEADEPQAESTDSGEDTAETEADDEASDESQSSNGSLRDDDERLQLLQRAREYAEEFTGHPVESFSGFASEKQGWRVGVEVVEVARVPSTTDVLASYEVVLTGDGDLVDFRRAGRYYRNAIDGHPG